MIEGRKPGRALDVGMGQGRNAIWLARQGWEVTGFDPAEKAVALALELADAAGVKITTETIGSEDFDWGNERWDLIVLSYVTVREWTETIHRSLRPGGLVMLEAFHDDATKNASIGRGVVYETNELLELFSDLRILHMRTRRRRRTSAGARRGWCVYWRSMSDWDFKVRLLRNEQGAPYSMGAALVGPLVGIPRNL